MNMLVRTEHRIPWKINFLAEGSGAPQSILSFPFQTPIPSSGIPGCWNCLVSRSLGPLSFQGKFHSSMGNSCTTLTGLGMGPTKTCSEPVSTRCLRGYLEGDGHSLLLIYYEEVQSRVVTASHLASTWEDELKIKLHREEGAVERYQGQLRHKDLTEWSSSPVPGPLIYMNYISLLWMFGLDVSSHALERIQRQGQDQISLQFSLLDKSYKTLKPGNEASTSLTSGLRDRFFRPTEVSACL